MEVVKIRTHGTLSLREKASIIMLEYDNELLQT